MQMERTSEAYIIYNPRDGATPEAELDVLTSVYRFLIHEKGDRHDLTNQAVTEAQGVSEDKKGQDRHVRC